jgi:drug/metabolite transporter (DMT)-like permease
VRADEPSDEAEPPARASAATEAGPLVHVALLIVQVSFASGAIAGKWAMNEERVDPVALAFVRAGAGALAFQVARALFAARREADAKPPIDRGDHARFALFAVLGVCVNQAFFLLGLKRGTASSAALLAATIPVFTAAIAVLARVEKPTARTFLGVSVASAGVLALTGGRDISIGNLLITINSLSYAAYLVFVRPLLQKHGALTAIAWVFTYGALLLAPFGAPALVHDVARWSSRGWLLVGWFVAVPTVLAYLANAWALQRARASIVSAYIYLQPLLVLGLAGKLLGEALSLRVVGAGAAILVGVTIIASRAWGRPRCLDSSNSSP